MIALGDDLDWFLGSGDELFEDEDERREFAEFGKHVTEWMNANAGRYKLNPAKKPALDEVVNFYKQHCSSSGGIVKEPKVEDDLGRVSLTVMTSELNFEREECQRFADTIRDAVLISCEYFGKDDTISFGNIEFYIAIGGMCMEDESYDSKQR